MTTPRGKAPQTETEPHGRHQAKPSAKARRPKAAAVRAGRGRTGGEGAGAPHAGGSPAR